MATDLDYPRTLIVGVHINEQSGSGIYLGRLFTSWPIDRLATVDGGTIPRPDWRRCQQLYRTGELRFPLQPFSRWLLSGGAQGPVRPSIPCAISTSQAQTVPRMSRFRQLIRSPWPAIRQLTGGGEIFFRVEPSQQLLSWVRDFQPQVIYGQCTTLNGVRFLRRMHQLLGTPLVLHFMDDWADTNYSKGWVAKAFRKKFESEFRELVQSADVAIAICQEMADEYEKRYQRPVLCLPMPVELEGYQAASRTQWKAGCPFRIRYGGRVGWAIRESLADLSHAIYALRKDGVDVEFDIATFEPETLPDICRTASGVKVQIPGSLADLPRLQAEADVLLICYDFDPHSFAQARYSMPAKLAPCMASGTPILVYGPAGLPVVEYARRDGWGMVVDQRDPVALQEAIRELINSGMFREQLGRTAKRLAAERHDAKVVSGRFCEMLAQKEKKS